MSLMTEDERNELLWVILRMGLYNEEPKQMSRVVAISWSLIRTQMEVNNQRYENSIQRRQKDRKSTRLNSSHSAKSRMPSSA